MQHASPCLRIPFFTLFWPFGSRPNWSVSTLCDFIHVRCDEKGISLKPSMLSPSCWLVVSIDPRQRKNHDSSVGPCQVSTVFSSRTVYTERTNYLPQSRSGALVFARRRWSCRVQGSIEWVLVQILNNTGDERLWGRSWWLPNLFRQQKRRDRPNLWLEHFAQNQQINVQCKWNH